MSEPFAKVETLIRTSPREIFEAFTEPRWLKKFWLADSEAPLELGKRVHWEFLVPGAKDDVIVRRLEKDHLLVIEWSNGSQTEWTIDAWHDGWCKLKIVQTGFVGEDAWEEALETTQGFAYVVAELKLLLETGRTAGIVRDKAKLIAGH